MTEEIKNIEINLPAQLELTAGATSVRFTPYKENFVTQVPAGKKLSLVATTVGQYLYYVKQGFVAADSSVKPDIQINVPAKITITNNSDKVMNFIPYKENFQQELQVGQSCIFEAKTAGQVLYYLAQDTSGAEVTGGLDVSQVAVKGTATGDAE